MLSPLPPVFSSRVEGLKEPGFNKPLTDSSSLRWRLRARRWLDADIKSREMNPAACFCQSPALHLSLSSCLFIRSAPITCSSSLVALSLLPPHCVRLWIDSIRTVTQPSLGSLPAGFLLVVPKSSLHCKQVPGTPGKRAAVDHYQQTQSTRLSKLGLSEIVV